MEEFLTAVAIVPLLLHFHPRAREIEESRKRREKEARASDCEEKQVFSTFALQLQMTTLRATLNPA
jgi:hypothetical protein